MAATRFLRDARSGADICLGSGRVCSAPAPRFYAAEKMVPLTAHTGGWRTLRQ